MSAGGIRRAPWHLLPRAGIVGRSGAPARRGGYPVTRGIARVVVVGAGPSGLAAAAMLASCGVQAVVLEQSNVLAAPWHTHYDRVRLQSPKGMSNLPGMGFGWRAERWITKDTFLDYLQRYQRHFGIDVRFGVTVERIARRSGSWQVLTDQGDWQAPVVVVATGLNRHPVIPEWPGLESFTGELLHSARFRNAEPFRDRDVLVIGTGNSGAEIASIVAHGGARRTRVAYRTPPHVVPRSVLGFPTLAAAAVVEPLPGRAGDWLLGPPNRAVVGNLARYGLPRPPLGVHSQYVATDVTPIIDTGFLPALRAGLIEPVAQVVGFDDAHVRLADNTRIRPEVVIAATGYRSGLRDLIGDLDVLTPTEAPAVHAPDYPAGAPGLFFIGYVHPFSGNLRAVRRDAPRLARTVTKYLEGTDHRGARRLNSIADLRRQRASRREHRPEQEEMIMHTDREHPASNRPVSTYPRPEEKLGADTIPGILESAATEPTGITLVDRNLQESPLMYSQLRSLARRVAGGLAQRGIRPGDRVVIMSSTSIPQIGCLFGAWLAGAVPVIMPLPHRIADLPELMAEIDRRLTHVDASCLIVADKFHGFLGRRIRSDITVLKCGDLIHATAEPVAGVVIEPDDLAYLQFTSGTTGNARAVMLTHRQMLTNVAAGWEWVGSKDRPVGVMWLPLYHDMGLISLLAGIATRSKLIVQPPEEYLAKPDSWIDALSRYRAWTTVAPNFAYELAVRGLVDRPRPLDLSSLVVCGNGAEPIRVDTMERFAKLGARYGLRPEAVTPLYGMAEGTVAVTSSPVDEPMVVDCVSRSALSAMGQARPVSPDDPDVRVLATCGRPLAGIELEVRDEQGRALGDRMVGEIWFRSPSAMLGYWNEPEETARVLVDGWVCTGDLGYLTDEGVVICGRRKDMIIVGGRNLFPEDYENVTARVPGVGPTCVAFALPDSERMLVLVEPETAASDYPAVAAEVMRRLRSQLGHAPDKVAVVARDSVPRTSSGKVQRGKCRERYIEGRFTELASVTR